MSKQFFASEEETKLAQKELETAQIAHQRYLIKQQEEDWNNCRIHSQG